jgi:NADH-quinone oxidoreductase subunit E
MAATEGAAAASQPASFSFDADSEARIPAILAKYPAGRQASAVLPLLDLAQRQVARVSGGGGWAPRAAMDEIARRLGMAPIRVYEVATFYFMISTEPVGKYHLQVCTTTPCWLRGSEAVVHACRKATGIAGWGTSEDGKFTLTEVECLGACVNAPILQVNDNFFEDLDADSTERLIEALKRGEAPTPGSATGRQASMAAGGATTLTFAKTE